MMKHRMAEIWRPAKGMTVRDLGNRLIIFRFYLGHITITYS
ncbi:hypothetical protein LINPERHAP1_LOCUS14848 [Linum perenne]